MTTKKIILIDDDETVRKTFVLLLGKKYRVVSLKDPLQALTQLKSGRADLVIADYRLPHMTGSSPPIPTRSGSRIWAGTPSAISSSNPSTSMT
jgi:ActR/RegA family two-component response regulator